MASNSRSARRSCRRRLVAPVAGMCLLLGLSGSGVAFAQDMTAHLGYRHHRAGLHDHPGRLHRQHHAASHHALVRGRFVHHGPVDHGADPTTAPATTSTAGPASTTGTTAGPTTTGSTTTATTGSTTTRTTAPTTTTGTTSRPRTTLPPTTATSARSAGTNAAPAAPLVPVVPGPTITPDLSAELAARQLEVFQVAAELDRMDAQLGALVEEYNLLQLKLQIAKQAVVQMQGDLDVTEGELANANEALRARVVGTYKSEGSALAVILNTTDMADFVKRIGLLVTIARSDRSRIDEVGSLRSRADRQLDELSRQIYDLTLAAQRLAVQRRLIESQLAERKAYLARLGAEVQALVEQQRGTARNLVPAGVDLAAYASADGQGIVKTALTYLGVPYVWGGATPSGFDCSGLVQYVYLQHGIYLPHYSGFQAQMGIEVPLAQIAAGDLVAFRAPVSHIGIYIGNGLFIQAPRTGDVVKVSRLADRSDLTHIRRILVSPAAVVATAGGQPSTTP